LCAAFSLVCAKRLLLRAIELVSIVHLRPRMGKRSSLIAVFLFLSAVPAHAVAWLKPAAPLTSAQRERIAVKAVKGKLESFPLKNAKLEVHAARSQEATDGMFTVYAKQTPTKGTRLAHPLASYRQRAFQVKVDDYGNASVLSHRSLGPGEGPK
jgi:hypothetical protein